MSISQKLNPAGPKLILDDLNTYMEPTQIPQDSSAPWIREQKRDTPSPAIILGRCTTASALFSLVWLKDISYRCPEQSRAQKTYNLNNSTRGQNWKR